MSPGEGDEEKKKTLGGIRPFYTRGPPLVRSLRPSDQLSGHCQGPKSPEAQKLARLLSRFIAVQPLLRTISSERAKMEQKWSDFWTKFQRQQRRIAVAELYTSDILGCNLGKKGKRARFVLSLLHLLHQRQTSVRTPENGGSESINLPPLSPKHLVRESVVLLP